MAAVNVEELLRDVAADPPCGPNLEHDGAYKELERAAQGKPEQQIGNTFIPAIEPDWRVILKQATALLGRSKDLRLVLHVVRALLHSDGYAGLADGLAVLRGLLDRHWDPLHPQLDPEEHNDPTIRINVLMALCDPGFVTQLRRTPLLVSRSFGRVAIRDVAIARGEEPPATAPDAPPPLDLAKIQAAFIETDLAALQATLGSVRRAAENVGAVEALVGSRVAPETGPNLVKLTTLLKQAERVLHEQVQQRLPAPSQVGADTGTGANGASALAGGLPAGRLSGEITSREDVIRALDSICAYYERHEPSSPIPLLMRRGKRLVNMPFVDIVRDLAPDAVAQVENLRGREPTGGG